MTVLDRPRAGRATGARSRAVWLIDGYLCADQFAAWRLMQAGLVCTADGGEGLARLAEAGRALVNAT